VVTSHEFLTSLHSLLKPKRYLEIGVQYGRSLNLAVYSAQAVGVDPAPLTMARGNQVIHPVTADDFFTYYIAPEDKFDLIFIDGSHLYEDALRDLINCEKHSRNGTVMVLDDVLPYTPEMTSRTMVPGHWTGDVWKVHDIVANYRDDLTWLLVDTSPTGSMVICNLNPLDQVLPNKYWHIVEDYDPEQNNWGHTQVPDHILQRTDAVTAEIALESIMKWRAAEQ